MTAVCKGGSMTAFRHEYKHEISLSDLVLLTSRFNAVLTADEHAGADGSYSITSLYFDDLRDSALTDKLNGVDNRDKFRLRRYGSDLEHIKLEKKSKRNSLCLKESVAVSRDEVERIINGDIDFLLDGPPLCQELYSRMRTGLKPKAIVAYTRRAYTFPVGNVRVTLDYDLRTSSDPNAFFDTAAPLIPTRGNSTLLEVKWDEFLPDFIADLIFIPGRHSGSFSKYAQCRVYG